MVTSIENVGIGTASFAMSQAGDFSYILGHTTNVFDDTLTSNIYDIDEEEINNEVEKLREKYESLISSQVFKADNQEAFKGYIKACLGGSIAQVSESVFSNPNSNQYYDSFEKTLDWEEEWQKYLEIRGCKNEKELTVLNSTMCKTMEQFKNMATTNLNYIMTNGMIRNPEMSSAPALVDDLIKSANLENTAKFLNSTYSDFNTTVNATQEFLSKIDNNNIDKKYLDQIIKILDKLPEQIEAEKAQYEENGYVDFSVYYHQYNQNMIAKYGQSNMIGQSFREIYV